jgi:integrase
MSIVKRGKIFHYDFWHAGQRFQGSTQCKNKADAILVERQVREGCKPMHGQMIPAKDRTLDNALMGYFKGRKDQKSLKSSRRYAAVFCDLLGPKCKILELDHDQLLSLREQLEALRVESRYEGCRSESRDRGAGKSLVTCNQANPDLQCLSNATVNRYLQFLRRVIRWGSANWRQPLPEINWSKRRNDHLMRSPILKPEKARTRVLQKEEAARLAAELERIRPELLGFFAFETETGLRTETACAARWEDMNWDRKTLTVTLGKVDEDQAHHIVNLSPRALEVLRGELGNHPKRIFTLISRKSGHKGKRIPVTCGNFRKALKEACAAANIANFRNHDFRHTAATRLAEETGDMQEVMELLGVKNEKTAMRYVNRKSRLQEAQARMTPLL